MFARPWGFFIIFRVLSRTRKMVTAVISTTCIFRNGKLRTCMAALIAEEPGGLPGALLHYGNRRFLWLELCSSGRGLQLSSTSRLELARHRQMQPELLAIPGGLRECPAQGDRVGGHSCRHLMQMHQAVQPVTSPTEASPASFALCNDECAPAEAQQQK